MKVSWKWLNELIDLNNIKFSELTEKLILAGFEIEEIYELTEIKDKIIDIKLTANRQDASFLFGLAREISILFNKKLENYNENINNKCIMQMLNLNNTNISYQSLDDLKIETITNIQNRPSPKWLKNYLKCYNIQATDILNDIIEYIKIKWGQDIEIFDAKKIDKLPISNNYFMINNLGDIDEVIENKKDNNTSYNVSPEFIKYKSTILSIIGIQSNKKLKCDLNTSSIIVCGTICKPIYIKTITEQLNVRTEKSIKHLKQILRCDFIYAYKETIKLISTFAKGTIGKSYKYHNLPHIQPSILINKNTIYNILGPNRLNQHLPVKAILNILHQLKFKSTYNNMKQRFKVTIPVYRTNDIKRPIDVIEEIGRIHGFDQFNDNLPSIKVKGTISGQAKIIKKVRKILRDIGIHEVIHYSLKKHNGSQEDNNNRISLFNPLTEDQAILQYNLFSNLLEIQQYNTKQKNLNIEAFEIGRIFRQNKKSVYSVNYYKEEICIAGLMGKSNFSKQSWSDKPKELSWFQGKGILEEFFEKLQAKVAWKQFDNSDISVIDKKSAHLFYKKRTSIIYNPITKEDIGFFGQLQDKYNSHSYCKTYIFEISLYHLMKAINHINHLNYQIKPYSLYPSVTRDISIKLSPNENIGTIRQKILNQNNSLIESVEIFNEYKQNNNLNRNIGLRIIYRAQDRTLNDADLIKIDKEIKYLLKNNVI